MKADSSQKQNAISFFLKVTTIYKKIPEKKEKNNQDLEEIFSNILL